jgi:hypothetical protein
MHLNCFRFKKVYVYMTVYNTAVSKPESYVPDTDFFRAVKKK